MAERQPQTPVPRGPAGGMVAPRSSRTGQVTDNGRWDRAGMSNGDTQRGRRQLPLIHTGIELRVMLINLTAISTGFWIREEMKRKAEG